MKPPLEYYYDPPPARERWRYWRLVLTAVLFYGGLTLLGAVLNLLSRIIH